ncbi:MAG: gamma-glutamyltransferase [Granulosicoccus sp.]
MRNFQLPGRSPVLATQGMAATSHPLATNTALKVLQGGGNAVDAAIAASAVLCVVEPQMTGIGGDCFAIVHEPDGQMYALNGSGRAAAGAHFAWYQERGIADLKELPAHTVTVPGALKAWDTLLERFGSLDFTSLFVDAIHYAESGFPVAPRVAHDWATLVEHLTKNKAASTQLLRHGSAPETGDIYKLPGLAETLKRIAKNGIDVFYTGSIAAEIACAVQNAGGFLNEEDIAAVSADWVEVISTGYNGFDVHEIPPNGQGITALVLLELLQHLQASDQGAHSAQRVHMEIESARLAYSVRDAYVGDADTMRARVEHMLSRQYVQSLAASFDPEKRNPDISLPRLPDADTIYLTVVDRDLRAVSFINSLYSGFGSGIVTEDSGICLQNRGACFSLIEGHDNVIGPSKRPMHTIIPGMVSKNGKLAWSFGVMGGAYQPMGHAHVLTNMIDYGLNPQEALDHGRVFWGADGVLDLETGISRQVSDGLAARGHEVRLAGMPLGGGQIIGIDHDRGIMIGASDPRKDGAAAGY